MSLDISLIMEYTKEEKDHYEVFEYNITHNLTCMAEEAQVYMALWRPEELGYTKASHIIHALDKGLETLIKDPEKFKKLNPKSAWGTYESLINFIKAYRDACLMYPDATIHAWR